MESQASVSSVQLSPLKGKSTICDTEILQWELI